MTLRADPLPPTPSGEIIKIVQANTNEIVNIDDDAAEPAADGML